jgi:hypothetical protein
MAYIYELATMHNSAKFVTGPASAEADAATLAALDQLNEDAPGVVGNVWRTGDVSTYEDGDCTVIECPFDPDNPEQFKLFTPEYFRDIGFSNVSVSLVGPEGEDVLGDDRFEGGSYEQTKELSWPFRQFVYLVQGRTGSDAADGEGQAQRTGWRKYVPSWLMPKLFGANNAWKPDDDDHDDDGNGENNNNDRGKEPFPKPLRLPNFYEKFVGTSEAPAVGNSMFDQVFQQAARFLRGANGVSDTALVHGPSETAASVEEGERYGKEDDAEALRSLKWMVRICGEQADLDNNERALRQYRALVIRGMVLENEVVLEMPNGMVFKMGKPRQGESAAPRLAGPAGSLGDKWNRLHGW